MRITMTYNGLDKTALEKSKTSATKEDYAAHNQNARENLSANPLSLSLSLSLSLLMEG